MIYLCFLVALSAAAYPSDMNVEKCESDGIYWLVEAGDLIPCSPTCDETYKLSDKNELAAKTINEHCKLDTKVGKYYHDIANKTTCACTNGAAYKELTSIDWRRMSETSRWFCIPPSQWSFQSADVKTYKVVCL